jgi:hypothetical protein
VGTKRSGTSTIAEVTDSTLRLTASPSLSCIGDSGGPILLGEHLVAVVRSGDPACAQFTMGSRVTPQLIDEFITPFITPPDDIETSGCAVAQRAAGGRCWNAARTSGDPMTPSLLLVLLSICALRARRASSPGGPGP